MAKFELKIYDPSFNLVDVVQSYQSLVYPLRDNQVTSMKLVLSDNRWASFGEEYQIEIFRQVEDGGQNLEGNTRWIVNKRERDDTDTMTVEAVRALGILARRSVLWPAESAQASMSNIRVDDMIKLISYQNLGGGAVAIKATSITGGNVRRDLTFAGDFSIQANQNLAAATSKAFAYRPLLAIFQDLALVASYDNIYIGFDVVATSAAARNLELRTYYGTSGIDRTDINNVGASPVVFSPEHQNITGVKLTEDWSNVANYIYGAGQGQGAARLFDAVADKTSIAIGPYALREYFKDVRQSNTLAGITAEIKTELTARRFKRQISGQILQVGKWLYGRDYYQGDKVLVEFKGERFPVRIESVNVSSEGPDRDSITVNITNI